ncbi:MAG: DUF2760 domain-containing protein [Candidatus Ozemobacteraceae bacterium]
MLKKLMALLTLAGSALILTGLAHVLQNFWGAHLFPEHYGFMVSGTTSLLPDDQSPRFFLLVLGQNQLHIAIGVGLFLFATLFTSIATLISRREPVTETPVSSILPPLPTPVVEAPIPEPKQEPKPRPEPATEPKSELKPEIKMAPKPESKIESKPETKPEPKPEPQPEPKPVLDPNAPPAVALQILYLLQKEGRLLDFLMEDITPFADEELGGAIRPIHADLKKILQDRLIIEHIIDTPEGETVELGTSIDAHAIKLTGNVPPNGPYKGTLIHRGWKLRECKLPELVSGWEGRVVAPAEVEIA